MKKKPCTPNGSVEINPNKGVVLREPSQRKYQLTKLGQVWVLGQVANFWKHRTLKPRTWAQSSPRKETNLSSRVKRLAH